MAFGSPETGGVSIGVILPPRRAALTAATTAGRERLRGTFSPVCKLLVVADAAAALAFSSGRILALITVSVTMVATITATAEAGMSIALRAVLQRARRLGFSKGRYVMIDNRNEGTTSRRLTPHA